MSFQKCAPGWRLPAICWLAITSLALAACGGSSGRAVITDPIGSTTTNVVLSTATGSAQLQAGATLVITASVTNDTNNAGVTWALSGDGALSNQTTKSATYTAPVGITGTTTPVITATSVADTTKSGAATLIVSGLPVIAATTLFPGNLSSPYGANIVVSGGLAPFTWTLSSGALPAGITLGTTTTASFVALSGTPTATGVFNFQVNVVDKNSNAATVDLLLTIKAAAACLLDGHYALLTTGFTSNTTTVGAASLNIVTAGTVTGTQDYKTSSATVSESVSGTCSTRTANNGELKLTGTAHS
ncbi:MAG: putative Ig domain-containing protein, partial [Steroidobacteraceae bacterium]